MQDPEPECLEALAEAAGSLPLLLTLAPERNGAVEMIRRARSLGFVVSLGHTNATPAQLAAALDAGATGFTHLGNGCPPTLDRGDNILWRVLDAPPPWVSLIPDGHHVSPPLFRLLHRVLGPDRVLYVTDAMAAAAAAWPGRYRLGSLELEASAEGVVRLPGGSQFAGSALSPIEGIRRAAGMRRCSWQEVWDAGSLGPARAMGLPHGLGAGAPADGCVIRTSASNEILSVYPMTGSPRQAEPGPGT
jgi:N-acetylglucosamine-6-phosphate deacetylase